MIPLKAAIVILLTGAVVKFGKPFRAAALLALLLAGLVAVGGASVQEVGLRAVIALGVGGAVFWVIDSIDGIAWGSLAIIIGDFILIAYA